MGLRHLCGASLATLIICAAPSAAQTITPDAGAYLAARSAGKAADFEFGARYYAQALIADPSNPAIMENALTAQVSLSRFPGAINLANRMQDIGINRQIPNIFIAAEAAAVGNWDKIFDSFDRVTETSGLRSFGIYHKALALASLGEYDAAIRIFDLTTASDGLRHNRRSAIAHARCWRSRAV